jgi:hypothetical protein
MAKKPKRPPGIGERHARSCAHAADANARCNCDPTLITRSTLARQASVETSRAFLRANGASSSGSSAPDGVGDARDPLDRLDQMLHVGIPRFSSNLKGVPTGQRRELAGKLS